MKGDGERDGICGQNGGTVTGEIIFVVIADSPSEMELQFDMPCGGHIFNLGTPLAIKQGTIIANQTTRMVK